MSLQPSSVPPVPEETARIARAAFRRGNLYLRLRDEFGALYEDEDFARLFPARDQPGLPPWRLALVTVMQFLEGLSDRQAADAVRARIDWKYALSLDLTDPGFDFSVLSEFRGRLVAGGAEQLLLERMLELETTPATVHEAMRMETIHEALAEKGLAPEEHLVDAAYVSAAAVVKSRRHSTRRLPSCASSWTQKRVGTSTPAGPVWRARFPRECVPSDSATPAIAGSGRYTCST